MKTQLSSELLQDIVSTLQQTIVALDMDDKFGDDIDARHDAEEIAHEMTLRTLAKLQG